jgi:DNA-binding protein H-NS
MARTKTLQNMSPTKLGAMQTRIAHIKIKKQSAERSAVREKILKIAKDAGFDIGELFDSRKGKRSKVAVKYRDPNNPANKWTGRGRMPRWLVAATKGGKAKKEDFLVT